MSVNSLEVAAVALFGLIKKSPGVLQHTALRLRGPGFGNPPQCRQRIGRFAQRALLEIDRVNVQWQGTPAYPYGVFPLAPYGERLLKDVFQMIRGPRLFVHCHSIRHDGACLSSAY
jgi:hypothetical protein